MEKIDFHHVIDFAVEREKEAVQFYAGLKNSAKFDAHKKMLQELEDMEKEHILTLEKMRTKTSAININNVVSDMKISDYMVTEQDIKPDSYPNILILAMKSEEASYLLYQNLAQRVAGEDEEMSKLFKILASEEAAHKLKFERLYDEDVLVDN